MKSGGTFYYRGTWMGNAYGIITVDPSKLEYMLKTRFRNFPKGKYYRDRFFDLLGDGIFNADDAFQSLFVEYSFQTIQELVHIKLLKLIEKLVISKDDIWSRDPGCLSIDLPDVPFAKAFEQATEMTLFRFTVPPFIWKSMKLFCIGSEKELKKAVGVVHKFAEKAVCNRRTECYKLGPENQFKYAVFNAGPRLCVGKRFAYLHMKMVASVLLRYSVDVVKGHDVAPKLTTTLYMKKGLIVNSKPRE
ncbi:hypothetical protein MKW92_029059 [Papaver armeniacum]|nr:hypothetical protein MKW92_029059 [Papaver armeniacum]